MTTKARKTATRPVEDSDAPELELSSGRFRRIGRGRHAGKRITVTLADARTAAGKTQVAVAEASGMQQADVSRLEHLASVDDVFVGTLRRYVLALGGELELVAIVNGDRIVLRSEAPRARALKKRASAQSSRR
jgi:hypothetical protein